MNVFMTRTQSAMRETEFLQPIRSSAYPAMRYGRLASSLARCHASESSLVSPLSGCFQVIASQKGTCTVCNVAADCRQFVMAAVIRLRGVVEGGRMV